MGRRVGVGLLGLLVACHPAEPLSFPGLGAQHQTLVLALPEAGLGWGHDLGAGLPPPLALRDDDTLVALYYAVPLTGLGLEAGPLTLLAAPAGRPAPAPEGGGVFYPRSRGWVGLEEAPDVVAAVRLPSPPPAECRSLGGCLPATTDTAPICQLPCAPTPVEPPAPVVPPELPRFGACAAPAGTDVEAWVAAMAGCLAVEAPADCPPGTGARHGEADCAPLAVCPASGWPEGLGAAALYVDPAAAPGGDGTPGRPLQSLDAALARGGREIALRGASPAPAGPLVGVRLVGACPAQASVEGSLQVGAGSGLVGLTVTGTVTLAAATTVEAAEVGAVVVQADAALTAARVLGGVTVQGGGRLTLTDLAADDGLLVAAGASVVGAGAVLLGESLQVAEGGQADLEATTARRVLVGAAGRLSLRDALVLGAGVTAARGAQVDLHGTELRGGGMSLRGATLAADDLWVADGPSHGLLVEGGGLELTRAVLSGPAGAGLRLLGATTSTLTDLVVADVRGGHGVFVDGHGLVLGRRWSIQDVTGEGLRTEVEPEGAPHPELDLEDLAVRGAADESCVAFLDATKATLHRLRVEGCGIIGLRTDRPGTTVEVTDVVAAGVPLGVRFEGASRTNLTRALIASSRAAGVCVDDPGTVLVARHIRVQDTLRVTNDACTDLTAGAGFGLAVNAFAQLDLATFEIDNSASVALELGGPSDHVFRDGVVKDNPIGVHSVVVWPEAELMRGVRFEGNAQDFDLTLEAP